MYFIPNVELLSYVYILVPSEPPQSVTAGVINATSAWIRWDPPPVHTWNGEISGYLVSAFLFYCILWYLLAFRVKFLYIFVVHL